MTPKNSSILTALIYTRVSKEEQARDGVSLDAQLTTCRRYAAGQGWCLGREFQDVLSGTRDDRPQYQALLTEVRRHRATGQPVVVVVARLNRLGRRLLERVRCREELKALGVPVHSVHEGGEVLDLVANVLAAVTEEEVRALGERVTAARRHIAVNGGHLPGQPPWGYRWRPATTEERSQGAPQSVLEVDPVTAPHLVEAFSRAADGATLWAVHRWASGLPEAARGGRVLNFAGVRLILASPTYIARPPQGDEDVLARPLARWPALVDDATWRRVREQVAGHSHLPRQASRTYLLTGVLRCPRCGARMHGRRRSPRRASYECMSKTRGANAPTRTCTFTALAPVLEELVLAEVLPLVELATGTLPSLQTALSRAWDALRNPDGDGSSLAAQRSVQLERIAQQARGRLTTAAVLFADGDLDRAGYELLREKARTDLEAAEAELGQLRVSILEPSLPPLETILGAAGGWSLALRTGGVAAQREVLATVVERVLPMRVRRGEYAVEFVWTPLGQALRHLHTAWADHQEPLQASLVSTVKGKQAEATGDRILISPHAHSPRAEIGGTPPVVVRLSERAGLPR
ncbi:MAG: recombinase family protein [Chloroflexota bacterium]|nr:recombinase family protein [Chloroflexota bacterium]